MSSLMGGGPDTSGAEKLQKDQMRLQKAQAQKLAEKERREIQIEAARKRSLWGRTGRSIGSNQTLFGSYLGVPKNG